MDGHSLVLGQRWPEEFFSLPAAEPSFGWHFSGRSPFLVMSDPFGLLSAEVAASARIRLGFAQFGPLVVVAARAPEWPFGVVDSPRPFLFGDDVPEVTVEEGGHILWQLVTVSRGVIVNMRAFTTSPEVTVFLRRAFAEQRAAGAISTGEADEWIWRWQDATPSEGDVWRRCVVTCKAGD